MESKVVSIRMNKEEYEELENLSESEGFRSKSDFMRELIRNRWDMWAEKVEKHYEKYLEDYISLEEAEKELEERERNVQG